MFNTAGKILKLFHFSSELASPLWRRLCFIMITKPNMATRKQIIPITENICTAFDELELVLEDGGVRVCGAS